MHRAQKASSKLCYDREVEKAQELHKRKIDGVKSYLTAITRPPPPTVPASNKTSKSSTFFRRTLRQHAPGSKAHHAADLASDAHKPDSTADHSDVYSDDEGGVASSDDGGIDEASSVAESNPTDEVATKSFGKLDELRSVLVPVMAYKGHKTDSTELDYEQYLDAITNPPPPVHEPPKPEPIYQSTHSLRATAFRMRRLKQIETDNVTIFERIKNSTAHYRTESLKKDWDQNVAYLTSICAYPVVEEALHAPARRTTHTRKRSPFASRPPDQLPSLQLESPPVAHPIKAIPTSPKKANALNLSPAFRSLRKGLPQVPALPPLTASPRATNTTKLKSMSAVASSRSVFHFDEVDQERLSARSPSPAPRADHVCTSTVADDPSRYTLLKIGRFVGGKYLILTVFCGDGITNPYGFDVVALDPEVHLQFHLSITKETTHLLLETISSSSMAERTAAAAGTNLSMELIARCICDHIRYARIGTTEVVFLVATVGNRGGLCGDAVGGSDEERLHHNSQQSVCDNASLLVDTPFAAMTFSFHQYVRIPPTTESELQSVDLVHVFASTRPQQCCRASMQEAQVIPTNHEPGSGVYNGLVCFEVSEESGAIRLKPPLAQLQLSVNEIIRRLVDEDGQLGYDTAARDRHSFERFIIMSLHCLHLVRSVDSSALELVLKPSQPNNWVSPVQSPSRSPCRTTPTVLPSSLNAYDHLHHFASGHVVPGSTHKMPNPASSHDELKNVLQTGMLWRGVYLYARVALLSPGSYDETSGLVSREPRDELLVFNILNTSTGKYAERILTGDQVEELSQKLGDWQSGVSTVPPLIVFAKLLLLRMRVDVDLRGQEILLFPTLEPRYHNPGGGSSPVSSSRQNAPLKQGLTSEKDLKGIAEKTTYSLDFELQEQTDAARTIQVLARRFLRRRRYRVAYPGSTVGGLVADGSLPAMVLAFMRNRAAKRIQFATRNYKDLATRRRKAHDLGGVKISTPRSLTPTTTTKSRINSHVSAQAHPMGLHVDNSAVTAVLPMADDSTADDSDDDDDEGDGNQSKHVDVLGILPEDEQEEEEESEKDPFGTQLVDDDSASNSTGDTTQSNSKRAAKSSVRTGKKANDRFVLVRYASEQTSETIECRTIGPFGDLQSKD